VCVRVCVCVCEYVCVCVCVCGVLKVSVALGVPCEINDLVFC